MSEEGEKTVQMNHQSSQQSVQIQMHMQEAIWSWASHLRQSVSGVMDSHEASPLSSTSQLRAIKKADIKYSQMHF